MTEIVLHVGAHKCATTSLQRSLQSLAQRDSCIHYRDSNRLDPLQRTITQAVLNGADGQHRQEVADAILKTAAASRGIKRFILSNENFLGRMLGLDWQFYPNVDILRDIIDRIAARAPTRVLLQSRESASYLRSSYQFRVRNGLRLSYDQFLQRCDLGGLSWLRLGDTLLHGADFRWRVLPIENLRGSERQNSLDRTARFLHPDWELQADDFPQENATRGTLVRCVTLHLNKMGCPMPAAKWAFEQTLTQLESTLLAHLSAGHPAAPLLLQSFQDQGLAIGLNPCRAIVHDFAFSLHNEPGQLEEFLRAGFAADYAGFLARYVAPEPTP